VRARFAATLLASALGALPQLLPGDALAEVASEIVRDGSIGSPDPALQPVATSAPDGHVVFEIPESLGERPGAGPNLLHSFAVFDLARGDRAIFGADPALRTERIISRVTGGRPSLLYGALESRVAGADLYFLNPAGIVFGPDAELDVQGSVIASTAHVLELDGGDVFAARAGMSAPLLSAPSVAAFGFLDRPASIRALGSSLGVRDAETLALLGGDLELDAAGLFASSGRIALASVGSAGRIRLRHAAPGFELDGFTQLGNVSLRDSFVSVNGSAGSDAGRIDIAADVLGFADASFLLAQGLDASRGGELALRARELALDGGSAFSVAGIGSQSGRIQLNAQTLRLAGDSFVSAAGFDGGNGGSIQLDAQSVRLAGASSLGASSFGGGDAGRLEIVSGSLELAGESFLVAEGLGGGRAGQIGLRVRELALDGGSMISTAAAGGGAAGSIQLDAQSVELAGASAIRSSGFDGGAGGSLDVVARSLRLEGASVLSAQGMRGSKAGQIALRVGELALEGSSGISTFAVGGGAGGSIDLDAKSVRLAGASFVSASSVAGGDAGRLDVSAESLRLEGASDLRADGLGGSNAGRIALRAGSLVLEEGSISVIGESGGASGQIDVSADTVRIVGASQITASGVEGSAGGSIVLRAVEVFISGEKNVANQTGLGANSENGGRAGTIRVVADRLRATDQTRILAVGFDGARGGEIDLDLGRLLLTGGSQINAGGTRNTAGSIAIRARELVDISNEGGGPFSIARAIAAGGGDGPVDFGGVFAASGLLGGAGTTNGGISIAAPEIRIRDGGFVAAASFGPARAGTIRLDAERILLTNGGAIDSSTASAGDAGSVQLLASERILIAGQSGQSFPSRIRSLTVGPGAAGDIVLRAPTVEIDGGALATSTLQSVLPLAAGPAGSIHVQADTLSLRNGGRIDSSSFSGSQGGRIAIDAARGVAIDGAESGISARSASGGDGGAIRIVAPDLALRDGASISTESSEGLGPSAVFIRDVAEARLFVTPSGVPSGAAGSIALDVGTVRLRDASRISTRGVQGTAPGEPVQAFVDIAAARSIELSGASEITASVVDGRGGDIRITTPGAAILRDQSRIVAQATGDDPARFRQGGRIDLAAGALLQDAHSLVSADAGQGVSGTVSINAPEVDLEPELTRLPVGFLDAAALFKPRCAAAAQRADASSFVLAAQTALPPSPEEWLVALAADSAGLPDVAASTRAVEQAEADADGTRLASALGRLGNAFIGVEDPDLAERYLARGLGLARGPGAEPIRAALLNDLGNAHEARGAHAEALALYLASARQASGTAAQRARANAARAALGAGDPGAAAALVEGIEPDERSSEAASRAEIELWIHLGVTHKNLAQLEPGRREPLLLRANLWLERAAQHALANGDFGAAAQALGNRGGLYESEHRTEEALELTRQALAAAERTGRPDALYRWHSQLGRLLWAQGRASDALDAHRRAVRILGESRHELAYVYARGAHSFGDSVGPVYRELVQSLLAASSLAPAQAQSLLLEARSVVEQQKAAELRDYFRDECLAELESRSLPLDAVSPRSAVVYPIVLPDRLEILLTRASGVKRYTVPVSAEALSAETLRFRKQLGEYATSRYLASSWKLYDWLVRPYAAELAGSDVQTLVFVTGGPLRTIPMGALHDRQKFLLESYAVAVTPSLALTDPRPLALAGHKLLLAGISEPVQGFGALPSVDAELHAIERIHGGTLLLDKSFTAAALREKLAAVEYSALHLASHARFTGRVDSSFLLAYDGPVSIRQISDAVRATRFRERPLELLVMSACETAAGDEQAALGLAGVAIKSGARSAVGSLWSLNDRSATELMSGFYRALGEPGVSKAEALRRAQLGLIRKGAHPYFWSPFLVIGNWL
jgi:filamentous hemagglutinin family protein